MCLSFSPFAFAGIPVENAISQMDNKHKKQNLIKAWWVGVGIALLTGLRHFLALSAADRRRDEAILHPPSTSDYENRYQAARASAIYRLLASTRKSVRENCASKKSRKLKSLSPPPVPREIITTLVKKAKRKTHCILRAR